MEVKFDFSLNHRFHGVVEQGIFRLVLRGIDSVQAISDLLWVFSDEGWANLMAKIGALPYSKAKQLRKLFAYASDCEPDAQGRILLSTPLRNEVGLEKEVIITGSFDRVEIWPAQRWAELETELDKKSIGEVMEELGL